MKNFLYGISIGIGIASASYLFAAGFNDVQIGPWVINSSNNAGVSTTTGIRETSNTWPVQIATSSAFSPEGLFSLTTYGSTTIQTPINTLNAFRVQNSASTTVFAIDTLNSSTTVRGPLFSSNSSNLGSSGSRWGTLFANTVDTNALTFVVATPSNANFGSNISVNGGTINLGASPNTATTTLVANGSGQLTISSAGTNQNVVLTPSGTGFTLLNGNVGIGTTGPLDTLHVQGGTGYIRYTTTGALRASALRLINNSGGNWYAGAGAADGSSNFQISQAASASMFNITTAGNVGIGTTTPSSLLSVQGNELISGTSTIGSLIATSTLMVGGGAGSSMVVTQAGNVGIGTAAPTRKLEIAATNDAAISTLLNITNLGTSNGSGARLSFIQGTSGGTVGFITGTLDSAGVGRLSLYDSTSAGIDIKSGNVGIGTTSPGALLDVYASSANPQTSFRIDNNSTGGWYMTLRGNGADRGYFGVDNSVGGSIIFTNATANSVGLRSQNELYLGTGATADMMINSSGNVGIGTTSPAKLLSSSGGDALISNTGTTTLNVDTPTANRGSCLELRAASSSDIYRLYVGTNPNNQDSLVVERGSCK